MNTRDLGKKGETIAADHLVGEGYKILERNYTTSRGEIDIIAEDKTGELVFIEVKTAYTDTAGDPAAWVNLKKQKQIGFVASAYLARNRSDETACRFDVVTVIMAGKNPEIRHYENAFMLLQG